MFLPLIAIFESETTDGAKCFEAHCLDRPGCMTHGISIMDAYTNIWDAIELYDNIKNQRYITTLLNEYNDLPTYKHVPNK